MDKHCRLFSESYQFKDGLFEIKSYIIIEKIMVMNIQIRTTSCNL